MSWLPWVCLTAAHALAPCYVARRSLCLRCLSGRLLIWRRNCAGLPRVCAHTDQGPVQRAAQQADNFWVVKLAQGARSTDVFVSDLMACIVCHRAAPGDRVAQACVRQPVLFQGRKVDLRVRLHSRNCCMRSVLKCNFKACHTAGQYSASLFLYTNQVLYQSRESLQRLCLSLRCMACLPQAYLAVRSFEQGEAFLYRHWYGRVAQQPYSLEPGHAHDHHRHFTVSCYDPDEAVSSQQVRLSFLVLAYVCGAMAWLVRA